MFRLFPVQKDHPLLLGSHTQRTGVLFLAGLDQSFFSQGFQQTSGRTRKTFALILTEFPNQLVGNLVIQVQKFRILVAKTDAAAQVIHIIFIKNVSLITLQQSVDFANKLVGRLVLVDAVGLFPCQPGEDALDSFESFTAPIVSEAAPLDRKSVV